MKSISPSPFLLGLLATAPCLVHSAATSPPPIDVDVVVVGGGYSGMAAAYKTHQAGLKTVVLEAKDVVGGRSRTHQLTSGPGVVELGATWINNTTQPRVTALTSEFGLDTIVQYTAGDEVSQGVDGVVHRKPPIAIPDLGGGSIELPDLGLEDIDLKSIQKDNETINGLLEVAVFIAILKGSSNFDIRNHSTFPVDQDVTFAEWMDLQLKGLYTLHPHAQGYTRSLTRVLVGREPEELGAHYLLDYVASGGGLISLGTETSGGAQYLMIKQGTQAIPKRIAEILNASSGSVVTGSPVTSIATQEDGTTLVGTGSASYRAKKVILAIPTSQYSSISFSPRLPCNKTAITSKTQPGIYAKVILTYTAPWWRDAGLVGKFSSHTGPLCYSWEISVPEFQQYSLATFVAGDVARKWHDLSDEERRRGVIENLAVMVGSEELAAKARDVLEVNYVEWTKEEYIWGGPTNSMGPGLLRKLGSELRRPAGSVHFAGGELAYEWKGYLEGAITSGERAADEVIHVLGGVSV